MATIVVLEGSLAFLGLSGAAADAELGQHAQRSGQPAQRSQGADDPWLVIFPASAMFLLLISLNVIADKLRAYFDVTDIKL